MLGVFLSFFQQWCGLNAIFYYPADIFKAAGYNLKAMMLNITHHASDVDGVGQELRPGGFGIVLMLIGKSECWHDRGGSEDLK